MIEVAPPPPPTTRSIISQRTPMGTRLLLTLPSTV